MYASYDQVLSSRVKVKYNPQVTLRLTADDWQLYSGKGTSMDYNINRDTVAKLINDYVAEAIAKADSRAEAYKAASRYLRMFDDYGTADSEGWQMLDYIFHTVYGESE